MASKSVKKIGLLGRAEHKNQAACRKRSTRGDCKRTARDAEIVRKMEAHRATSAIPHIDIEAEDGDNIQIHYPDRAAGQARLARAFGSLDIVFVEGLVRQLYGIASVRPDSNAMINFMTSAIRGIGPEDELDGMLATQMVANHAAVMKVASSMMRGKGDFGQESLRARTLSKLTQSFATQVDTLRRRRKDGEQSPKVREAWARQNAVPRARKKAVRKKPVSRPTVPALSEKQGESVVIPMKRRARS